MSTPAFSWRRALTTALAAYLPLPAWCGDFSLADGQVQGKWNLKASVGAGMRLNHPSRHLVGKGYRSDGRLKGGDGADDVDDGNLNFDKGDIYSAPGRLLGGVDLKYRHFGVNINGRAWYDYQLKHHEVPQGHVPNGFEPDARLDDSGLSKADKFSGFMWLDTYVYGNFQLGDDAQWDIRVGRQRLQWGEGRYFAGIGQTNPFDLAAVRTPGSDPASELQLPIEMLWNKLSFLDDRLSLEGYWQWKWRRTETGGCGTFFSAVDLGLDGGCSGVQTNALLPVNAAGAGPYLSDRFFFENGAVVPHGRDFEGKNSGQWGLALHYKTRGGTDWGLYHLRYNNHSPIFYAAKPGKDAVDPALAQRLTALGVPQQLAESTAFLSTASEGWRYPNGVKLSGISVARMVGQWRLAGEASYSPNTPAQINIPDMVSALASGVGPVAPQAAGRPTGYAMAGYDRFKKLQLQANAATRLGPTLGAASGSLLAEAMWSHANLPSLSETRYGRGIAFGYAPIGGADCSAVQNPKGCRNDGYFSRSAWGYRLRGQLDYALPGKIVLSPNLTWSQDVRGYSIDYALLEGRQMLVAGLSADFAKRWKLNLAWTNYLHDDGYDPLADHDNLVLAASANF